MGLNLEKKFSDGAVNIFISYSHTDVSYLERLLVNLKPLEREGNINIWYDKKISPGTDFRDSINKNLENADIIVLLISPDFLASDFIYKNEKMIALKKHEAEEARVISVVIRPVHLVDDPVLALQVLPKNAKPVSTWKSEDDAWVNVLEGIKSVIKDILKNRERRVRRDDDNDIKLCVCHLISTPVLHPVGRSDEIESVVNAIKGCASMAITGIAGVGKTTILAFSISEIAKLKPSLYNYICSHRIVQGSKEVRMKQLIQYLADCLKLSLATEDISVQINQIRRVIANNRVLLAIDNADDVESRDIVQTIRLQLPNIVIVVTSRHQVWRDFERITVEGLSDSDGLRLFKENYKNINIDDPNLKTLCKRVKGHPMMITYLAIEARKRGIPPDELINQFQEFNIDRDLAIRFNSVFEGLSEKCREVIDVIGLLETGTLQIDLLRDVLQVKMEDLENMDDQFIIHLHHSRRHFTVHELIRTWCRNHLEGRRNQRTHLIPKISEFYLNFLKERRNPKPHELTEIDKEWPNILGLIDNLLEPNSKFDPHLLLTLLDEAIGDHFDDPNGYIPRRRQMASILVDPSHNPRAEKLKEMCIKTDSLLAARVEKNLGHFYYWRGDFEQAAELFHRAREKYEKHKNIEGQASTTWLLGYLEGDRNFYKEGEKYYQQGLELAKQVVPYNPELVAIGHHLIGCTLYHQGRFGEAEKEFLRAKGLIDKETVPHLITRVERRLACTALRMGRLDEAKKLLGIVKNQVKELERPRDAARIDRQLALLHLKQGNLEEAEGLLDQALSEFKEVNSKRGIGYTNYCFSILRRKQGRLIEARKLCEKSLEVAKETGSLYGEAVAYEEFANIMEAENPQENEIIIRQLHRAYSIYSVIGNLRANDIKKKMDERGPITMKLPANIKGILFDLMDTLAYLEEGVYEKNERTFAESLGVSVDRLKWAWGRSRIKAQIGLFATTEQRIQYVANELGVPLTEGMCTEFAKNAESIWRENVKPYDETSSLLEMLKKKRFSLAVISNGPVAMNCLKHSLGIEHSLDDFLLSCEAGVQKPDTRIYYRSLEKLGLNANECVFVGDGNDKELDGAAELGLFTIKINRCQPSYASIKNQSLYWDLEVNSLKELEYLFNTNS